MLLKEDGDNDIAIYVLAGKQISHKSLTERDIGVILQVHI